jgi:hypothetical protein
VRAAKVSSSDSSGGGGIKECGPYHTTWKEAMTARWREELSLVVGQKFEWDTDGLGVGIAGKDLQDLLSHCGWAREKCQHFHGREELLQRAMQLLNLYTHSSSSSSSSSSGHLRSVQQLSLSPRAAPTGDSSNGQDSDKNHFGIGLSLIGKSGTGIL